MTITASSAKRIAIEAPRSMPAGLSQITQSKRPRNSSMTSPTPSSVSASLSRACGGRQQPEILEPLVADQRLRKLRDALHHVDEVEHDAAFGPHHEVEVAQADVEIDDDDLVAALRRVRPPARRSSWSCRPRPCLMSRPVPYSSEMSPLLVSSVL